MNREDKSTRARRLLPVRVLRTAVVSVLVSLCGVLSIAPAAASLQALQTGMEAPDFSLKSLGGETRNFSAVRGEKLTILVFWSTWSSRSEKELKRMQDIYRKYAGSGLAVVGVNTDGQTITGQTLDDIKSAVDRLKISFPLLLDDGLATFHNYGVIAVPTTVIMDKNRVIRYELSGYPLVGSEQMYDFIQAEIEGKKTSVSANKQGYQPDPLAQRFYNMGRTTLESRRTADTAEIWFKKAIEKDPSFILPYLTLGKLYLTRGDAVSAEKTFRDALAKSPGNPVALCELGMIKVNQGNRTEANALFDAARKEQDSYAPCFYYSAYALAVDGRMDEAMKLFDEARKLNKFDYENFVYQGKAYEQRNEPGKAAEAYQKALQVILHLDQGTLADVKTGSTGTGDGARKTP